MNGTEPLPSQPEVIMPPSLDYGQDLNEVCDQVAVEAPPSSSDLEEQLEAGTQRQYSINDFELIR